MQKKGMYGLIRNGIHNLQFFVDVSNCFHVVNHQYHRYFSVTHRLFFLIVGKELNLLSNSCMFN